MALTTLFFAPVFLYKPTMLEMYSKIQFQLKPTLASAHILILKKNKTKPITFCFIHLPSAVKLKPRSPGNIFQQTSAWLYIWQLLLFGNVDVFTVFKSDQKACRRETSGVQSVTQEQAYHKSHNIFK